jgi:hypothetical protein
MQELLNGLDDIINNILHILHIVITDTIGTIGTIETIAIIETGVTALNTIVITLNKVFWYTTNILGIVINVINVSTVILNDISYDARIPFSINFDVYDVIDTEHIIVRDDRL